MKRKRSNVPTETRFPQCHQKKTPTHLRVRSSCLHKNLRMALKLNSFAHVRGSTANVFNQTCAQTPLWSPRAILIFILIFTLNFLYSSLYPFKVQFVNRLGIQLVNTLCIQHQVLSLNFWYPA